MADEKKNAAPIVGAEVKAVTPQPEGHRVKAPEEHAAVSVGGQTFQVAEDGFFYVPEHLVKPLAAHFVGIENAKEAEAKRIERALLRQLEEAGAVDMAKRILGK